MLFNAQDLLQTCGLNDLLKKDDQLIREIKELDTNMQMLVYENYNKFISATDTIRKMKVIGTYESILSGSITELWTSHRTM